MRINEKTLIAFACSKPIDLEGFLYKRREADKIFKKRWFVLKGNLLFYYEKSDSSEPQGMIILEGCTIELADYEDEKFCFAINFPGSKSYIIGAESHENMELWMKTLTTSSYDYTRLMINQLTEKLAGINSESQVLKEESNDQQVTMTSNKKSVNLRPAPPPPVINQDTAQNSAAANEFLIDLGQSEPKEDFNFLTIHNYFGKSWKQVIQARIEEKEKAEQPLIVL